MPRIFKKKIKEEEKVVEPTVEALESVEEEVVEFVKELKEEVVEVNFEVVTINDKKYKKFRRDDGTTFVEPIE